MKNISLFPIVFSFLFATIINVPGDQLTIQAGIDASASGDTVLVQAGNYVESINISFTSLYIEAISGPESTSIYGIGQRTIQIDNSTDTCYVKGFTISGNNNVQAGVFVEDAVSILENLVISNIPDGRGVFCTTGSVTHIASSIISNNSDIGISAGGDAQVEVFSTEIINNQNSGFYSQNSAYSYLKNVLIAGNEADAYGGGVYCSGQAVIDIENATITNNSSNTYGVGDGIFAGFGECTVSILNTILWDNGPEEISNDSGNSLSVLYSDIAGGWSGEGNIDSDPAFVDAGNQNYILLENSPCIDTGSPDPQYNDPDGTRNDIGAYSFTHIFGCTDPVALNFLPNATYDDGSCVYYQGPIWYVSVDGSDVFGNGNEDNPYPSIQQGINAAANGDSVLVLSGVYTGSGNRNLTLFDKSLVIISENGPDNTIIDCEYEGRFLGLDYPVQGYSAVIDGFTILHGHHNDGPAFRAIQGVDQSTIIKNCIIRDCTVVGVLGGIIHLDEASPQISNCIFYNNNARPANEQFIIQCWAHSDPRIINNIFWGNELQSDSSLQTISITGSSSPIINYNLIENSDTWNQQIWNGIGNFDDNPMFIDQGNYNFNISIDSPCIDTGDPDLNGNGLNWQYDFDDQDPDGTRLDIGTHYFHQTFGCTDPDADNFDPEATTDDGTCDYLGCTDESAINYDPQANLDDGSCIYIEDVEPHFSTVWNGVPNNPMGFYISSATLDNTNLRVGDEIAIYDGNYCVGQVQLASEIVPYLQMFASQDNPATEEIDGFINGDEITYRFWDASEQIEIINVESDVTNGSATFQSLGYSYASLSVELIPGCIDPTALNFDSEANTEDGSCIYPILGCVDTEACNFNPEANTEDGSCLYNDCNGDCGGEAFIDDCAECVGGNTDMQPLWAFDCNDVCFGTGEVDDCGDCTGGNTGFEYNYNMDCAEVCFGIAYIDACGVCDEISANDNACFGCTDPLALNYDPYYTIEDGSCQYPGMGDVLPDGNINVLDIVALVEITLESLPYVFYADMNSDGFNNIIDIVILVDIILHPELFGCTDSIAFNYNPDAIYDDNTCEYPSTVTDIDGNVYPTVIIGEQEWMAENLRVTHYRNDDVIPTGFDGSQWSELGTGAYAVYDNDLILAETYGYLYNWYAVEDERGICPQDWHVPDDEEWQQLANFLGGNDNAGGSLKQTGTIEDGTGLWAEPNTGASNESGFTALPGGLRSQSNGYYTGLGFSAHFWSSTEGNYNNAQDWELYNTNSQVFHSQDPPRRGLSIRCISDISVDSYGCTDPDAENFNPDAIVDDGSCYYQGQVIDIDGNFYETILIGGQEWMAENLKVTHYNNGESIQTGYSNEDWSNLDITETGAYAVYPWNNDEVSQNTCNGDCTAVYGNLYNWYAVDDVRGVCPEDWHVPTDEEYMELEMTLGMSYEEAHNVAWRGTNEGSKLAGIADLWNSGELINNPEFGSSGFLALPGGYRNWNYGNWSYMGENGYFWCSTADDLSNSWHRTLSYTTTEIKRGFSRKQFGLSIRCVKD